MKMYKSSIYIKAQEGLEGFPWHLGIRPETTLKQATKYC